MWGVRGRGGEKSHAETRRRGEEEEERRRGREMAEREGGKPQRAQRSQRKQKDGDEGADGRIQCEFCRPFGACCIVWRIRGFRFASPPAICFAPLRGLAWEFRVFFGLKWGRGCGRIGGL